MRKWIFLVVMILSILACNAPADVTPTPDVLEQLYGFATQTAQAGGGNAPPATETPVVTPTSSYEPTGKIAFTCQVRKVVTSDNICIMNADGSGFRMLTADVGVRHFYPSMAPDGQSVVYSAYREDNFYEIYEVTLDGSVTRLTDRLGILTAPEISPDGQLIAFTHNTVETKRHAIWVMNRDGSNPHMVTPRGWDPTWSPDGKQILFASDQTGTVQMYVVNADGSGLRAVTTNMPGLRGRTDWSPDGEWIGTYADGAWKWKVYFLRPDGTQVHQVSPGSSISLAPSFSPDGQWVAFMSYMGNPADDPHYIHGCEIYIMRLDGSDVRRLTHNDYCDWQPRWGP